MSIFKEIIGREPSCELEKSLFESVYNKTPEYIKEKSVINLNDKGEIVFTLKKAHLEKYDAETNPEGMDLNEWFKNYEREAKVSTAGIRGPQNILFPHDTRFPINIQGIMLATTAKAMAAREKYPSAELYKIAASEVRYNSDKYLDLIARVQAAHGITTHVPVDRKTIPIWLASFLCFKLDLLGGEYVTSSHGISVKTATKDLNDQGSQYLPEESMEFVNKIREIFEATERDGSYEIKISAAESPYITESLMKTINNGVDLYVEYLENGVATESNMALVKGVQNKVIIDNVGGCAYQTLSKVLEQLEIQNSFEWFNIEEDAFFHGIGKADKDPKGNSTFYDWSVDAAVLSKDTAGKLRMPVIETLHYGKKLADKPVGTVVLITDPDHDRLTIAQVEDKTNIEKLNKLGIDFVSLDEKRVLTVYTPNQGFLMIMDFWAKSLKEKGLWDKHPRFMVKTTASAMAWDEWGKNNGVKVVNVPVGFKEIANVMKKVEKQLIEDSSKEVVVKDIYENEINLGVDPRLVFGGEESGGMIIGPEELIKSKGGRIAVAMREKSATEAIVIAAALVAYLEKSGNPLFSDNLEKVFTENAIIGKFDVREDISYYNESEPDIDKLKAAKKKGEELRTMNDLFYLCLAMAVREGKVSIEKAKEILSSTFSELDFSGLKAIKFVGDGTYLEFSDKFIEIRPSGTDAKTKAYGAGNSKQDCIRYAAAMGNYSGERNSTYSKYINNEFYEGCKELSMNVYLKWAKEGENAERFVVPDYKKTLSEYLA